jgi:hypothetical protein
LAKKIVLTVLVWLTLSTATYADAYLYDESRWLSNNQVSSSYQVTDVDAFTKLGVKTIYYCLRQVDLNGKQSISTIKTVSINDAVEAAAISAYPNPVVSNLIVQVTSASVNQLKLEVFDLNGQSQITQTLSVIKGVNRIDVPEIKNISQGVYIICVTGHAFDAHWIKVVKTN